MNKKKISLALQGGGSHGAFTWGVLDEILADGRIEIEAISGASAGSMNASVAAWGIASGGAELARKLLKRFWIGIAQAGIFNPVQPTLLDRMFGNHNLDYSPGFISLDMLSRLLSPYQLNPLGLNPLREILTELVNFARLARDGKIKLFISATNVRNSTLKVFHGDEVTVEAVLASACLPFLFKAVEIKGQHYWDGGYMGNPTFYPLIHQCDTQDIVIVQINPIVRDEVPHTSSGILDRINEISFNSSLLHELRGLTIINRLLRENHIQEESCGLRHLHMHRIHDDAMMNKLSYASKMNTDYDFLLMLRDAGKAAARHWIDAHYDSIGQRHSLELSDLAA